MSCSITWWSVARGESSGCASCTAKGSGIFGVVRLAGIIAKDGSMQQVELVSSPDQRLAKAALDAAWQWRYQPARLNGEPIEVVTQIDIEFAP